jgi:hypothetical protein
MFTSRIAAASGAPAEPLLGDSDQSEWLHRRDQNIWVSAAEHEAQIADGKFIWDVDTSVIADPMANIDCLFNRNSTASSSGLR